MIPVSGIVKQKLFSIGYPPTFRDVTFESVIKWIAKVHKVEILAKLVNNKWCYCYRWIKDEPVMFFGCKSKNGYGSQEDALEAAILRIIKI